MRVFFQISSSCDHLVHLHEMITAGLSLSHFPLMGKLVNWNFGAQRQAQVLESVKLSKRFKFIVGAPLVETASVSAVERPSVVKRIEMGGLV
jgi:hypothetical protein